MNKKYFFILLIIFYFNIGCEKKDYFHYEFERVEILKIPPPDIKIPSSLWDLLEGRTKVDHGHVIANPEWSDVIGVENVFIPLRVRFLEKNEGVLQWSAFDIVTSRLGARIDLADYINKDVGTFYFSFKPELKVDMQKARVFFMSKSRRRTLDGQIVGAGCNRYFQVTNLYNTQMFKSGLSVNVEKGRHHSLIVGTWLIVIPQDAGLNLIGSLTLVDSRFTQLDCPSLETIQ